MRANRSVLGLLLEDPRRAPSPSSMYWEALEGSVALARAPAQWTAPSRHVSDHEGQFRERVGETSRRSEHRSRGRRSPGGGSGRRRARRRSPSQFGHLQPSHRAEARLETPVVGLEGEPGRDADFVIVGGHGGFDYSELRIATLAVHRRARLYACNRDATFPMPDGPWPAVGAILAAVETATGTRAIAVGKPEPGMFEAATEVIGPVDRIAMVGDNPASDIEGGRRAGLTTVLVDLSRAIRVEPRPNFVVASLGGVLMECVEG